MPKEQTGKCLWWASLPQPLFVNTFNTQGSNHKRTDLAGQNQSSLPGLHARNMGTIMHTQIYKVCRNVCSEDNLLEWRHCGLVDRHATDKTDCLCMLMEHCEFTSDRHWQDFYVLTFKVIWGPVYWRPTSYKVKWIGHLIVIDVLLIFHLETELALIQRDYALILIFTGTT